MKEISIHLTDEIYDAMRTKAIADDRDVDKMVGQWIKFWTREKSAVGPTDPGILYLVLKHGDYKVGKTANVGRRLELIGKGAKLLASKHYDDVSKVERKLLNELKDAGKQIQGEWFTLSEEDVRSVQSQYFGP